MVRFLVKFPLGSDPIEMWLTAPDLDCRPPAVIRCFLGQLEQTRFESCRRRLDAAGLVLVDGSGDALAVTVSLRTSGVADGASLLLLPSLQRLEFLMAETAETAGRLEAGAGAEAH